MAKPVNYGKYASFTRGDLIRTIEKLLERETKLLNMLAQVTAPKLPWENVDLCDADGKPVSECKGQACKAHGRCCWQ